MALNLEDKIRDCLYGAVIGAELGLRSDGDFLSRTSDEECLEKITSHKLEWCEAPQWQKNNKYNSSLTALLDSCARAYIKKDGRITPEDWAGELKNDLSVSEDTDFWMIGIHSTIELLREGMNPRISGFGAVPFGQVCTAVIPVGIYHAGDPETAYLDAVEIASVTQRSPAVEWAALTAAAVAEALKPDATPESVIEKTIDLARRYAGNVFEEINGLLGKVKSATQEEYLVRYKEAIKSEQPVWHGHNPIGWALALLSRFGKDTEKLITLSALGTYNTIRTPVAGAIAGALNGTGKMPEDWMAGVEKYVEPMIKITNLIKDKLNYEHKVIKEIEELSLPSDSGRSLLFDKVYGCILAGAIGNAMGSPVECLEYWQIDEKYPGGITTVLDPSRLEGEDDNQMAMLLTETYIRRNGLPASARNFGETWKEKLQRDNFFYCVQNSYDLICNGLDARIAGHWSIVTGSTVMCMEPVGIYHLCDPKNAYIDATSISYMYQRGLDVTAASILSASVAEALRPDATVDSVLQAALDTAPKEKMITFDKREIDTPYDFLSRCLEVADKYTDVLEARKELSEKCLYYSMIDPLELLGLAYAMFKISNGDVRISAIGGTNIGRDSDTIAGRAAMLSGTLRGAGNVPQEWIGMIKPESLNKIKERAKAFTDLIIDKKLPNMKSHQYTK